MFTKSERILVARGGAIGDFILTLPVIVALKAALPAARLDILANRQVASLAIDAAQIGQLHFLDHPRFAPFFSPPGLPDNRIFQRYDLVVSYLNDPHKIFETNVRAAGVCRFVCGPAAIRSGSPASEQLAATLCHLQIEIGDLAPRLKIGAEARRSVRRRLGAQPSIALHVGSGSARKNWPLACWDDLIADLLRDGLPIAIVAGEAERDLVHRLQERFRGRAVSFVIDWPLRELAALLAGMVFVGHDSGISHLAAATGTPSLILFGATDPAVWAPLNENARVILSPQRDLNRLGIETVRAAIDQELMRIGIKT